MTSAERQSAREENTARRVVARATLTEEERTALRGEDTAQRREARAELAEEERTSRREENTTRRIAARSNSPLHRVAVKKLEDFLPGPLPNSIGSLEVRCAFCHALKWEGESDNMCCLRGAVVLAPPTEPPQEFALLWSNPHFQKRIRAYNSIFAFTSMGASLRESVALDRNYASARNGVYQCSDNTVIYYIASLARA